MYNLYLLLIYLFLITKLNDNVSILDSVEKNVGVSSNDSTDETSNVESKQNILKKLSEFLLFSSKYAFKFSY